MVSHPFDRRDTLFEIRKIRHIEISYLFHDVCTLHHINRLAVLEVTLGQLANCLLYPKIISIRALLRNNSRAWFVTLQILDQGEFCYLFIKERVCAKKVVYFLGCDVLKDDHIYHSLLQTKLKDTIPAANEVKFTDSETITWI